MTYKHARVPISQLAGRVGTRASMAQQRKAIKAQGARFIITSVMMLTIMSSVSKICMVVLVMKYTTDFGCCPIEILVGSSYSLTASIGKVDGYNVLVNMDRLIA